jgi:molybdenum cofactor sulfurtransferase
MCNPGAAAALLGFEEGMDMLYPGVTLKQFESIIGREMGVIRISLGLASNFQDVWTVIRFATLMGNEQTRQVFWDRWMASKGASSASENV